MIDFDAVVLNPASNIFSVPCRFTPLVSQPQMPTFDLRGVYSSNAMDVEMQDGTIFSDQRTSLGIRLRDFPNGVPPDRGDIVEVLAHVNVRYWIGDVDLDGQGGALLPVAHEESAAMTTSTRIANMDVYDPAIVQRAMMAMARTYFGTRFKTYRVTPMLQVQPSDLPVLGIYNLRQKSTPWGNANHAEPKFQDTRPSMASPPASTRTRRTRSNLCA